LNCWRIRAAPDNLNWVFRYRQNDREVAVDAARLEEKYNRELDEMTDEIQAGIKSGKYTLEEIQKVVTEKGRVAADATDQFVRENPWAALGIAAAAGCVFGLLLSRK
jgi:ElaB/YqjD/DUF883 family membrane-anchored ribosome-binding protein